jgi:DNA-directed RNA polymerase subunit H (RpoH/RPB5)
MDLINKITNSRTTLKKCLDEEWDTSNISDYSMTEIETLYNLKKYKGDLNFGVASNLNITLTHKKLNKHKLHIIYYNFPELNSPNIKITKQCGDKMLSLYNSEIINPEDSIIIIINENITENIAKTIEDIYNKGQEYLLINNLSDEIIEQNEKLDENKYNMKHFRNIHIFQLDNLSIDIGLHTIVPKHESVRFEPDKKKIHKSTNTTEDQLPIILRTDPMAKLLRLAPGDICKITRKSQRCGEYLYYRICH